jgi:hypothetical protein
MRSKEGSSESQQELAPDYEPEFDLLFEACKEFTMKSRSRLYLLWKTVRSICQLGIPGDLVECGVWRGGTSLMMALTLKSLGQTDRELYLYDTFSGISEPTTQDERFDGQAPRISNLEVVRANLLSTGYPEQRLHFVCGEVEETIPRITPQRIALFCLETDWYESAVHGFNHLYPRVSPRGAVIIESYRHWKGERGAVEDSLGVLIAIRMRYPNISPKGVVLLNKLRSAIFAADRKT